MLSTLLSQASLEVLNDLVHRDLLSVVLACFALDALLLDTDDTLLELGGGKDGDIADLVGIGLGPLVGSLGLGLVHELGLASANAVLDELTLIPASQSFLANFMRSGRRPPPRAMM